MPRPLEHTHCTFEGCNRPHKARGLCATHYLQSLRSKTKKPKPIQERRYDHKPICTVEGCDGAERSKGLCGMHYVRWVRHGDLGFRYKASK